MSYLGLPTTTLRRLPALFIEAQCSFVIHQKRKIRVYGPRVCVCMWVWVCVSLRVCMHVSLHHFVSIIQVGKKWFREKKRIMDGPTDQPMDRWTDRRTDGPTEGRTDRPSYRDAGTHLKMLAVVLFIFKKAILFLPFYQDNLMKYAVQPILDFFIYWRS